MVKNCLRILEFMNSCNKTGRTVYSVQFVYITVTMATEMAADNMLSLKTII